jgi:hypothetical protein
MYPNTVDGVSSWDLDVGLSWASYLGIVRASAKKAGNWSRGSVLQKSGMADEQAHKKTKD